MKDDPSDTFDVCKMDVLPFQIQGTPYFMLTDTLGSYLAASEAHTHYLLLDFLDHHH